LRLADGLKENDDENFLIVRGHKGLAERPEAVGPAAEIEFWA